MACLWSKRIGSAALISRYRVISSVATFANSGQYCLMSSKPPELVLMESRSSDSWGLDTYWVQTVLRLLDVHAAKTSLDCFTSFLASEDPRFGDISERLDQDPPDKLITLRYLSIRLWAVSLSL